MEQIIARQPIFNAHRRLYAYELLYRGAAERELGLVSGEQATTNLLTSAFLTKDIEDISGHRPCFINFTQALLERNLPAAFPKNRLVIEILEGVDPSKRVLAVCRNLREMGYHIALDDFVYHRSLEPLLELAHIVKIDVRLTPLNTLMRTLKHLARHKVKLLAEKVETQEEFEKAVKLGFTYFQGYFFCKPEKIRVRELSSVKVNLMRLLAEVVKKNTDIDRLREIISTDVAVTYKLMRFLNSAYFYTLEEITSVEHAIAYLGERELRRFVMLIIVSDLTTEKPEELVRLALVRAKFVELLSGKIGFSSRDSAELFVVGLFSLLDAMLDIPMQEIVEKLPLGEAVKASLLGGENKYTPFIGLSLAIERNHRKNITISLERMGLELKHAHECYVEAVKYAAHLV